MHHLTLDPADKRPAAKSQVTSSSLPQPRNTHTHPAHSGNNNATLTFIGTATTLLNFGELTVMTDPNFLHAGDHVHLGPGVNATRQTNPAIDLDQLPHVDLVLLSHYHEDHFDREVEHELRRDIPIITTPHAKGCLVDAKEEGERFSKVYALDTWETARVDTKGDKRSLQITAVPGKHVPPGVLETANDLLGAVPPTNGWIVEMSTSPKSSNSFRIYITGDTLLVDDLKQIPERYSKAGKPIDLMLAHLGGTTIPSPSIPLLMVTMDAKMGVELVKMMDPAVTIPIHYDDYDAFASPLQDFKDEIRQAGLEGKIVFLERGDAYAFEVE